MRAADEERAASQQLVCAGFGDIQYARSFRRRCSAGQLQNNSGAFVDQAAEGAVGSFFSPRSCIWGALDAVGDEVQQSLCAAARFSYQSEDALARRSSTAATVHKLKGLALMSDKALARVMHEFATETEEGSENTKVAAAMIQLASACVNGGELLWTVFLQALFMKLEAGEWEGILLMQQARYDESPLKVRIRADGPSVLVHSHTEKAEHGKVMQTEAGIHVVVFSRPMQSFLHFWGNIPCSLKIMDRTTAETTKAAVLADYSKADVGFLQGHFPWKLRQATVDRYGANLKAERSILHDMQGWSKYTKPCDVHLAGQIQKKTTDLLESDISGLLNTALSQMGAGTLHMLQENLRKTLKERLTIIYDAPPPEAHEFRTQVLDVFLPVDPALPQRALLTRRYLIMSLFNGNWSSFEVEHYCAFNCCRDYDHCLEKFCILGVWALLGTKCPRWARNHWTNQTPAIGWGGVLAHVHNLLQPVLCGSSATATAGAAASLGALQQEAFAWPALGEDAPAAHAGADDVSQADLPDPADAQAVEDPDAGAGEIDWVQRNKAFRTNAAAWSRTQPAARLSVLRQVVGVTSHLMSRLMKVAGAEWAETQEILAAKGLPRSYRILEGARADDMQTFAREIMEQLSQAPKAIPAWAQTKGTRTLHFRLLSRALCGLQFLMRQPREGQPYQLFRTLCHGDPAQYRPGPPCLEDELSSEFYKLFPEWCPRAEACLRALALAIHVDVAAIESKHASARRLLTVKNVQSWVATLETLSAEWTHRQIQSRAQWLPANIEP